MTPGNFALQRVLDYRRHVADRLQLELSAALMDLARAEDEMAALRAAERDTVARLAEQQQGVLDLAAVARLSDELDRLRERLAVQAAVVRRRRAHCDETRSRVLAATKDVKALEKLQERKQAEHTQELRRLERIETSEVAAEQRRRQVLAR